MILLSLAFYGASAILSGGQSYVLLDPSTKTLKEGTPFSLDVYVVAAEPVNAIDISIAYPKDQIEVKGIDAGSSVITLWTKDPYIKNNTVYLQGGTYRKGFKGSHFIARIDAVAKQSGVAEIEARNIVLLAGDGTGNEVAVSKDVGQDVVQIQIANKDGAVTGAIDVIRIVSDIDGNGKVDLKDISIFMAAWFNRDVIYDFSGDNRMTFKDFSIILAESFLR